MKINYTLLAATVLSLACFAPARGATLLEFNFDQPLDDNPRRFENEGSSDKIIQFSRDIARQTDNPFYITQPELNVVNRSGFYNNTSLTNYASTGTVTEDVFTSSASGINLNRGGHNAFTMEGWIKPVSITNTGNTILWHIASSGGMYQLGYTTDGSVYARFQSIDAGVTHSLTFSEHKVSLNVWTHLAYVYNGGQMIIYMNGAEIARQNIGLSMPSTLQNITLLGAVGTYFGYFDDFRLSDVALTPAELGYHQSFSSIPEPSAVALALAGLGLFGAFRFRRRME